MTNQHEMLKLNFFGEGTVFDHVGLAVRSIRKAAGDDIKITEDKTQQVSVTFADLHGVCIEFIEPLGDESPVSDSLAKDRKLLHLCFRVPDLEIAIESARKHKFHTITSPTPAPAFQNRRIVWLFNRTYGLVELVEA